MSQNTATVQITAEISKQTQKSFHTGFVTVQMKLSLITK